MEWGWQQQRETVVKRCSACGSTNVRRSGARATDSRSHPFHSPYRCHDCDARFWVVSRRARVGAAAGGAVALMIAVFVIAPMIHRPLPRQADAVPMSAYPASRADSIESYDRRRVDDII